MNDNGDCHDDVIFVEEVRCTGVEFHVKIGETSQVAINVTGDNCGILSTNPIVID